MATISDFLIRVKVAGQNLIDTLDKSVVKTEKDFTTAGKAADLYGNKLNGLSSSSKSAAGAVAGLGNAIGGAAGGNSALASALEATLGKLGPWGAAAAAGAGAIALLWSKTLGIADSISDMSDATGISASRLMSFKAALIEAGGKAEDFEKMAAKLTTTLGNAANGDEKARKSFRDLGVDLGDANGNLRKTDDLLPDIIKKLAAIEDPAKRASMAVDMVGKSGAKIDWKQMSAPADPELDKYLKVLGDIRNEHDKIVIQIEKNLVIAFGKLAESIKNGPIPEITKLIDKYKLLNLLGLPGGIAQGVIDLSKPSVKPEGTWEDETKPKPKTGPLALTDAQKQTIAAAKAQTDAMIKTDAIAAEYQRKLNGIIGQQQLSADIEKATLSIEKDRDTKLAEIAKQIATETANKDRDKQVTGAIVGQLKAQGKEVEANARIMIVLKTEEINALQKQKDLMADIAQVNQILAQDLQVKQLGSQNSLIGLIGEELKLKQGLLAIENERAAAVLSAQSKVMGLGANATDADRARGNTEIAQAQSIANRKVDILKEQLDKEKALRQNAGAGAEAAFESIARSMDPYQKAQDQVNAAWGDITASIDNMVDNGKFSFEDLASSIIKDMIKIEMKALAMEAMGWFKSLMGGGSSGGGGGLLSGILSFFAADGGQVGAGKLGMVGEKGPELFVPRSAGTIVPNNQLGGAGGGQQITNNNTTVNHYTVNAVDAKSVAQLFAENRKQLLGTVRMAQAEQPFASRI